MHPNYFSTWRGLLASDKLLQPSDESPDILHLHDLLCDISPPGTYHNRMKHTYRLLVANTAIQHDIDLSRHQMRPGMQLVWETARGHTPVEQSTEIRVVTAAKAGTCVRELARQFDRAESYIRSILSAHRVSTATSNRQPRSTSHRQLLDAARSGARAQDLALQFGLSVSYVYSILSANGVRTRRPKETLPSTGPKSICDFTLPIWQDHI